MEQILLAKNRHLKQLVKSLNLSTFSKTGKSVLRLIRACKIPAGAPELVTHKKAQCLEGSGALTQLALNQLFLTVSRNT